MDIKLRIFCHQHLNIPFDNIMYIFHLLFSRFSINCIHPTPEDWVKVPKSRSSFDLGCADDLSKSKTAGVYLSTD